MSAWSRYQEQVWRAAAERRGGTYWPRESWLKPPHVAIPVRGGVARVDSYYSNKINFARVIAPIALRVAPVVWVSRENVFGRIAKALRLVHDAELGGHPEFDRKLLVKCDRVEEARQMWTLDAKSAAFDLLGRMELFRASYARLACEGALVSVLWPESSFNTFGKSEVDHAKEIELALSLIDALSAYGTDVIERMRALPDARYREPSPSAADTGPPVVELDTPFGEIRVWPAWQPWGLAVAVSCATKREPPPFAFDVAPGGTIAGTPPPELVSPTAAEELRNVGRATLVSDGREIRLFVGARIAHDALVSATRAVGWMASGTPTSAFR